MFGGKDSSGVLNTIERLNKSCLSGQASNWELIQPDTSVLLPRAGSAMVSLDARSYMIFGGDGNNEEMSDVSKSTNELA